MAEIETADVEMVEEKEDLMKNRRRMAYFSLYTITFIIILLVLFLVIKPSILESFSRIESIVTTIVLGYFTIIGLYFGANSVAEIFGNKIK